MAYLFTKDIALYYAGAVEQTRRQIRELDCADVLSRTDDEIIAELSREYSLAIPSVAEGDPEKGFEGDVATYVHKVVNAAVFQFRASGQMMTFGGLSTEDLDGDTVRFSVKVIPGMKPEQAREAYQGRLKIFQDNVARLAAAIESGNRTLPIQIKQYIVIKRKECEAQSDFRSQM